MEKEYAIGIDLGGTSVKYALIDNNGVFRPNWEMTLI